MTVSDELRQAAKHIREMALQSSSAPWRVEHRRSGKTGYAWIYDSSDVEIAETGGDKQGISNANGEHIALWDPNVAELVAALLDDVATEQDAAIQVWHGKAVELARAILAKAGVGM